MRRSLSTRDRAKVFADHGGLCMFCHVKIDGTRERWEVSHAVPLALGGADDAANRRPAHYRCHRDATAQIDVPQIRKADRQAARHTGAKAKSGTPLPCGRGSKWKRKISGETVLRDR